MQSRSGMLMALAAVALVAGVTVLQGRWTERWAVRQDDALMKAGQRLEQAFPTAFGEWTMDRQLETSKAELERAGAVGSISRVYRNAKTRTPVSTFVVCASPHDASGHTPDRCYPGAGFEIAEPEHRETITLRDGRIAEAFTGTFAKQGQTLRVFWTYGVPDEGRQTDAAGADAAASGTGAAAGPSAELAWVAPQIARIALNDFPAVYKLYAIIDQTKLPGSRATTECGDFIAELLPAFDAALAAERSAGGPAAKPDATPTGESSAGGESAG